VLGLSVFYQYVRTAALNQQQQTQHVSVFTTELFAPCLHIKYLLAAKYQKLDHVPSLASEIQRYRKRFYECSDMFITDLLVFRLERRTHFAAYDRGRSSTRDHTKSVMSRELDTSQLVLLLQQSAVEHLTECRQLVAPELCSVDTVGVVTTDFEALYAYKCGEYRRCLQLSAHNVCTLLRGDITYNVSPVLSLPEFIQLMDDNIASLSGLTLIVNRSIRENLKHGEDAEHVLLSQLCLSLYLMSHCRMKLHHAATLTAQAIYRVEVARPKILFTLDQLLLKLTKRNIQCYLVSIQQCFSIGCQSYSCSLLSRSMYTY